MGGSGQRLYGLGAREQTAVHSVHDGLRSDLFAAKESSIQTLDRILAALDAVKLQVDVALRVRI